MTHILEIEVPCVPVSQNKRDKMHWASKKRIKDAWRIAVLSVTDFRSEAAVELDANRYASTPRKVRISVTCYMAGKRGPALLDEDNLRAGLKPCYDAIRHAGLIKDDSPKYVEHGTVEQVIERDPKKHKTVIRLELLEG